jgi:hypothetical protein
LVLERRPQAVNKDADAIETHALAFAVEIEVLVMGLVGAEALHRVFKGLLDGLLVAFLVNEVDEVELAVEVELVVNVCLDGVGLTGSEGRGML